MSGMDMVKNTVRGNHSGGMMGQADLVAIGTAVDVKAVEEFEDAIIALGSTAEIPEPRHYFSGGMYCREMSLPADTTITGRVHKHDHIAILTKGKVGISTGGQMQIIDAPLVFTSRAGVKRIISAITDAVMVTVHKTDITDPGELGDSIAEYPRDSVRKALERKT